MKTQADATGLTFHTPDESGFPFILFWCVTGSLLAHFTTFFLFQVVYPQRVTIPQPAPHVSLLTPSSPENIALLRWIDAEDPALIASDNSVPPPALTEVRYRPSFEQPRTALLGAPEEKAAAVRFPPAIDRLSAAPSTTISTVEMPVTGAPTALRFADELRTRPLTAAPPLQFTQRIAAPVSPTTLLIGVNATGEVRYAFFQQSSGDEALDQTAADHLRRLTFAPAAAGIMWGHVIFAWGRDAYVAAHPQAP
jgi:hypothetical protein